MKNRICIADNIVEESIPQPCLKPPFIRKIFDLQCGSIWRDLSQIFSELKNRDGILLDVGCGAQPYRDLVPHNIKYVGIDWEQSKEAFGYFSPDTIYYSGNVWPVPSEHFNFILSTETLEHVYDTNTFIEQAWRCLKTSGEFIITVPFSARWHFIPHDYWRFTPSSLRCLLETRGFSDIRIYPRGNEFTVASYKIICLFLPFFFPFKQESEKTLVHKLLFIMAGILLSPIFLVSVFLGNVSLSFKGGNDCLGYTVIAKKQA